MHVLVCYEASEASVTRRTMERLATAFTFDLDVISLTNETARGRAGTKTIDWSAMVDGTVVQQQATGGVYAAISAACAKRAYDLVVVGLNERRGLVRLLLGSRVGRLVHSAPATIWIARGRNKPLRRIVLGVAGGPQTQLDAELAAILASIFGATVDLVHIVSHIPLFFSGPEDLAKALTEGVLTEMDPGLSEVRQAYGLLRSKRIGGRIIIRLGVVLEELLAVSRGDPLHPPADLLMVGAHQTMDANRPDYLEDFAEQITQAAPLSTLVIHGKDGWDQWRAAIRQRNEAS